VAGKQTSLGLAQGKLALAPSDEDWAFAFRAEAERIKATLLGIPCTIDHIGSTSVPGLTAKPILDLAVSVNCDDESKVASNLVSLGYVYFGIRSGSLFVRNDTSGARTHNLHLYRLGDPQLRDQISFRNALRSNPQLRGEYAALKQDLVTRLGNAGRASYAEAKSDFIRRAIGRS
jgi:GrpB-like predicted nucleotidyltransferase (UPF0157 family)